VRQAIAEAVQSAVAGKQQVVEPVHLAKALLEQPNGLARRIVVKVKQRELSATSQAGYMMKCVVS
jgi:ATP-dependent Clp protease ATP-binding subunit ClpA